MGTRLTRRFLGLLWVLLSLLPSGLLYADEGSARFARLTIEDGLPQSSVEHILQDQLGFLWFGTQEGLSRYDGYRFIVHKARDTPGFLREHSILALIQDQKGDLWIGTERGLHHLDLATGRIDREAPDVAELAVPVIMEDGQGDIWFVTSDGALRILERGENGTRKSRRFVDGLQANLPVTALARASDTSIWAVAGGRLLRIDHHGAETRATEVLRDLGEIRILANDSKGRLWMAGRDAELVRFDSTIGRLDHFPQAPRGILTILPIKTGGLWIGARAGGLSRLDPETRSLVTYRHDPEDPSSLSKNDVAALYEDRLGNLWIGCWNGGVNMLDPYGQAFRTFRHRPLVTDSLPDDTVSAMAETSDGRFWVGSRNGVIGVGDPRTGRFKQTNQFPFRVRALGSWRDDLVYVGADGGLVALDSKSGRQVSLPKLLRDAGLDRRPITAMRKGPEGDLWIASQQSLFRMSGSGDRAKASLVRFDPPVKGSISAFFVTTKKRVWIGSPSGELVIGELSEDGETMTFRPFVERTAGNEGSLATRGFVTTLHEDGIGRLWVGMRRGLGRIDPSSGASVWLDERDGLPSANIAGLLEETDKALWVATNLGLTRIDLRTLAMANFGTREGAQGSGYADDAYAKGNTGLLYFAGSGVTAFDPRDVQVDPRRPGIAFTSLEILRRAVGPRWLDPDSPLDRAIDSTAALTLGRDASVFSVELAALYYNDPKGVRFGYRLEGFDPDWIETDAQNRVATYTGLAPGDYKLRARARTKNGAWSDREATLAIHVLPPWWRTRTAMAGWCGLSALVAALAVSEIRRRNRVRIALLERETLLRESLTDPLTGLYNRRFLATYLQHEVPRVLREHAVKGPSASESGGDLLFLLMDVDHFKAINDEHSHAAGDRVLAGIAKVLQEHIRDSDLAVRWGGDEILIVSRSTPRSQAGRSAERLRGAVEALGREMGGANGPSCTLSIGYAAFPFLPHDPDALTWEQTLEIADRALMLTKQRGRNAHTGLLAAPRLTAEMVVSFLSAGPEAALPEGLEVARD